MPYRYRPGLWTFGGTDKRHVPVAGAFAVVERQSESKFSEANAGAESMSAANALKRELGGRSFHF